MHSIFSSSLLLILLICESKAFIPYYVKLKPFSRLYAKPAFLPEGFSVEVSDEQLPKSPKKQIPVTSVSQLKELVRNGYRVRDFDVRGDTRTSDFHIHPAVKALYDRKESVSQPGNRVDGKKIGLAIEGGGMRGCVSAGMVTAVWYLGLKDSVDIVYGSSAGSLVGAYFISGQLPYFGPEIYYDVLTTAGEEFIDKKSILRSIGLGALDFRLGSMKKLVKQRMGKPVLNLEFLLEKIVQTIKPLDWQAFYEKQTSKKQILKIIASGLLSRKAVIMSESDGNFQTVQELGQCMKASMLLPGVTGEVIRLKGSQIENSKIETTWWREWFSDRRGAGTYLPGSEPMVDSQLFMPIPYRAALAEGCTDVITLRTLPDGQSIIKKLGLMEKLIMYRFFGRKYKMMDLLSWMTNQMHKLVYAEDLLFLNEANRKFDRNSQEPSVFCIALPAGTPEVKRFETSREVIFESVRQGFAAAYDVLVMDPEERGRGMEVARTIWPDTIMGQEPAHILLQKGIKLLTDTRVKSDELGILSDRTSVKTAGRVSDFESEEMQQKPPSTST